MTCSIKIFICLFYNRTMAVDFQRVKRRGVKTEIPMVNREESNLRKRDTKKGRKNCNHSRVYSLNNSRRLLTKAHIIFEFSIFTEPTGRLCSARKLRNWLFLSLSMQQKIKFTWWLLRHDQKILMIAPHWPHFERIEGNAIKSPVKVCNQCTKTIIHVYR